MGCSSLQDMRPEKMALVSGRAPYIDEDVREIFGNSLTAVYETLERATTLSRPCPGSLQWIDGDQLIKIYRQLGALIKLKQERSPAFQILWEKHVDSGPVLGQPVEVQPDAADRKPEEIYPGLPEYEYEAGAEDYSDPDDELPDHDLLLQKLPPGYREDSPDDEEGEDEGDRGLLEHEAEVKSQIAKARPRVVTKEDAEKSAQALADCDPEDDEIPF